MRTRLRQLIVLACLVLVGTGFAAETSAVSAAIPHLEKRGKATQLIVDGKPFLALGGELLNSSSSSLAYMKPIWPRLTAMHLNTVLAPVSWELIEPQEGKFDFTIVDGWFKKPGSMNCGWCFCGLEAGRTLTRVTRQSG